MTLGDADPCPHEGGLLPGVLGQLGRRGEVPDRGVPVPAVALDLAGADLEPHDRGVSVCAAGPDECVGDQLARLAESAAVAERVCLVDEVGCRAPTAEPIGEFVLRSRPEPGDGDRLVEASDAEAGDALGCRQVDPDAGVGVVADLRDQSECVERAPVGRQQQCPLGAHRGDRPRLVEPALARLQDVQCVVEVAEEEPRAGESPRQV